MQPADNFEIGARIRAARERVGLTQAALALQVGVTRSAVAQWETGRAGQVGGHLAQIAAVLGLGIDHLLRGGAAQSLAQEFGERALTGDELALLRLYRNCQADDRTILLRMARRFSQIEEK
ncbi:MAG: helix-turn-helix transcriptional regulator [Acetobacteraceae bacterium]|nr:helix-turn-helix transcriptional regulator [Acetobacteraceae bacterium]